MSLQVVNVSECGHFTSVQKWCDDYLILDCVCVCFFRRFLKLRSFRFQRRFVTNDSRFVWEWQVVHSILSGSGSTLKAETSSPNLFQSFTAYDLNRKVPVAWKTGGKTMAKWMDALVSQCYQVCYFHLKINIWILSFWYWYHGVFVWRVVFIQKPYSCFPILPDWLILKRVCLESRKMRCFQEEAQAAHTQNSRRKYAKMRSLEWIFSRVSNYSHQKNTTSGKNLKVGEIL